MTTIANVRLGKAQTKVTASSHVPGIREGNAKGNVAHEPGLTPKGRGLRCTARRSTGINPDARDPIDPKMPNLTPA